MQNFWILYIYLYIYLAYFSPIFWIWGFFYSVDGQGFCNSERDLGICEPNMDQSPSLEEVLWPLLQRSGRRSPHERRRKFITQIHANPAFRACILFLRCLRKEFKEMLAISYLVLQACILLLRRFRQEWRISVFALFAYNSKYRCSRVIGKPRRLKTPTVDSRLTYPVSPYPLNLGGEDSPPKFRGRSVRNPLFNNVF